jgi:hypothetical protein
MTRSEEATPIPPQLAAEFYAWLWWRSEQREGIIDVGGEVGRITLWMDDKLAFRSADETKVSATMTGVNPSRQLAARAALRDGKVLQEVRIGLRRDDREFSLTVKGPGVDIAKVKLPQAVDGKGEEALYDRMFLYDELHLVLGRLFSTFAADRSASTWASDTLPKIRQWVNEA